MSNSFKSTSRPKRARKRSSAKPRIELADRGAGAKSTFRIGIVSIRQGSTPKNGRSFWELRYKDPKAGRDIKRRVCGLSRKEIKAMAEHLTREAYAGRGYLANRDRTPTVEDGLAESIRLSHSRGRARRERVRYSVAFVRWLADYSPTTKTWEQLRPAMVQAYMLELEGRGLAYDSVRLAVEPIRFAWRTMAENYPNIIRPLPRIKIVAPRRNGIECLEPAQMAGVLDWMEANAPALWPMGVLQGLCGLRMREAAALREEDVDLTAGTITVSDTGHHRPKTPQSYRTIPVCAEVLSAIREAIVRQKIRVPNGELFVNARGNLWITSSLSHAWTRTLRQAAKELDTDRLARIPARKLRAAFATMAGRLDIPDRLLKAYLGHSPGDVLGAHYRRIDIADLRTVSTAMEVWRKLAENGEAWKDSGKIANSENTAD